MAMGARRRRRRHPLKHPLFSGSTSHDGGVACGCCMHQTHDDPACLTCPGLPTSLLQEDEVPEDIKKLSPEDQRKAIWFKAPICLTSVIRLKPAPLSDISPLSVSLLLRACAATLGCQMLLLATASNRSSYYHSSRNAYCHSSGNACYRRC